MVDDAELESNVLDFVGKSFAFDRAAAFGGQEIVIFARTETESESKFRPKLVRLAVAFPRAWVVHDLARDLLGIARAGEVPGPRAASAVEAAAEKSEFTEQGIDWRRLPWGSAGYLYLPRELAGPLGSEAGRRALGLDPAPGEPTGSPSR